MRVDTLEEMNARARQLLDELLPLSAEDRALVGSRQMELIDVDEAASSGRVPLGWSHAPRTRARHGSVQPLDE